MYKLYVYTLLRGVSFHHFNILWQVNILQDVYRCKVPFTSLDKLKLCSFKLLISWEFFHPPNKTFLYRNLTYIIFFHAHNEPLAISPLHFKTNYCVDRKMNMNRTEHSKPWTKLVAWFYSIKPFYLVAISVCLCVFMFVRVVKSCGDRQLRCNDAFIIITHVRVIRINT